MVPKIRVKVCELPSAVCVTLLIVTTTRISSRVVKGLRTKSPVERGGHVTSGRDEACSRDLEVEIQPLASEAQQ